MVLMRNDETLVIRHLSDPLGWESDLPPLWKGRKIKYSRKETRNPDGSVNHDFYNEQRKKRIIEEHLEQNKRSK